MNTAPSARPWRLLALGAALLALAGRLWLIRGYGTALPFRDEWKAVAVDLLGPWLAGTLSWRDFVAPLNDHCLVLTRTFAFTLVRLNGQWNNLLETSLNALVLVPPLALVVRSVAPALGRAAAVAWTLLAGLLLALPITGENTLWGIQSLVFFQVALSVIYLWAVATRTHRDALWWLGQLAGGLALLTQQSAVLAPVAAALLLGWRLVRETETRRNAAAGLAFAALWIGCYFALAPDFTVTSDMRADSWRVALDVCLRQLAWPLPHPAFAFLLYAPWLWFAADRARRRRLDSTDALLLVLALWVGAQAAAIGFGRGGETTGFVSRYCDFLLYGVIVNAACLLRLWCENARALRLALGVLGVAWLVALAPGVWRETVGSHSGYILQNRRAANALNLAAVREFIATNNPATLARDRIGETLYTYPPSLIELLSQPRFRALLPPETGAPEARTDQGRLGWLARGLPAAWPLVAAGALGLIAFAAVRLRREPTAAAPRSTAAPIWSPRDLAFLFATLALAGGALWSAWPQPLVFNPNARWKEAFEPAHTGVDLVDLVFARQSAGPALVPGATIGAVALDRRELAPFWHGTLLPDLSFTGTLAARPFTLQHRFLVTPFCGWPSWDGSALRWRLRNPATGEEQWPDCVGRNPQGGFDVWVVDAAPYRGWEATIFLFDGRTDRPGWLGVARPAATDDPAFGPAWRAALKGERAEATHAALAGGTLLAAAFAFACGVRSWRTRSSAPTSRAT
ncbi:MAG TPA: hypothetical protein VK163_16025 [Opitutaceae bacterium]|nr:hypothetical protein [Opitutaceae bacterium]